MVDPLNFDSRLSTLEREIRDDRLAARRGGGEPPSGIEPRVARLEASVAHIERDIAEIRSDIKELRKADEVNFRLLFAALIAATLGLAGLMAKGFLWL